ncbi:MAG TPA: hypothetical protein VIF82_16735 [Burkholderiaceae bacterium]|jgi:hypothetical protein
MFLFSSSNFLLVKRRAIGSCLMAFALLATIYPAHASPYDNAMTRTVYHVFSGDVNGDGTPDILVKADFKIIMLPLDDDGLFPLPIPAPSPTFVLLSQSDGSYVLTAKPDASIVNSAVWQANSHDVIVGDVLGNGAGSILVKTRTPGQPSFVVAMSSSTGALQLVQVLTTANIGIDLGAAGTTVTFQDQNGDGRTDLVVSVNGRVSSVLVADASGTFHVNDPSSTAASARAVWNGMLNALSTGDTTTAVTYIIDGSKDKYTQAFTDLGPDVAQFASSFGSIDFVHVSSNYIIGVVTENYAGQTTMGYINFILSPDGWSIEEF